MATENKSALNQLFYANLEQIKVCPYVIIIYLIAH